MNGKPDEDEVVRYGSLYRCEGRRFVSQSIEKKFNSEDSTQHEIFREVVRMIRGFTLHRYEDYTVTVKIEFDKID